MADAEAIKKIFAEHGPFDVIFHLGALHKPMIATHTRQQFIDSNITGTLNLLDNAIAQEVWVTMGRRLRHLCLLITLKAHGDRSWHDLCLLGVWRSCDGAICAPFLSNLLEALVGAVCRGPAHVLPLCGGCVPTLQLPDRLLPTPYARPHAIHKRGHTHCRCSPCSSSQARRR